MSICYRLRSFHVRDLLIVANDIKSHILPLALNDFSKTMATFYGVGGNISLTSHPFKAAKTGQPPTQFDGAAFSGSIFLGFTYTLVIMGFAMELIYDRQVKERSIGNPFVMKCFLSESGPGKESVKSEWSELLHVLWKLFGTNDGCSDGIPHLPTGLGSGISKLEK